jgi:GNAT superfamily N-acetyltransferase/uncharacterized membrane protein
VLAGLLAISIGTLYQKRHASSVDPRSGLAVQHLAALVLLLPLAVHEGFRADGSAAFFASLGWVIGINSLTTFALFFVLLRRGAVNQVATLFFLMPPVTALINYLVLGDLVTAYKLAGLALAALGVYLATRPRHELATQPKAALPAAGLLYAPRTVRVPTRLRDGRQVLIRPIKSADLDALKCFFAGLSPLTLRSRFHALMREVPERLLRHLARPDEPEHVAFIAEADGRPADAAPQLVAEARYIRPAGSDAAEFALVVADDWRRVGLGTSLMQTLVRHARRAGVRQLCGDALADNDGMRQFMHSLGGRPSAARSATVQLCLSTDRPSVQPRSEVRA